MYLFFLDDQYNFVSDLSSPHLQSFVKEFFVVLHESYLTGVILRYSLSQDCNRGEHHGCSLEVDMWVSDGSDTQYTGTLLDLS